MADDDALDGGKVVAIEILDDPARPAGKFKVRTLDIKPGHGEMIKPAELIDVSGHSQLTLADKRIYNALVANAFGPAMGERGREFHIRTADLRGTHKSNERLKDSIERLMKTIVRVRLIDGQTRRVQLLGANDMYDDERPDGVLTYSFDAKLVGLLKNSTVFGKLEVQVMMAFTSSYALSLYEAVAKRYRLRYKNSETLSVEELRDMLGVAEGKLDVWGNLFEKAIKPALREINALAAFGVGIRPLKTGRKVSGVVLTWWGKNEDELREAWSEIQRPKIGRKARLEGKAEQTVTASLPPLDEVRRIGQSSRAAKAKT
ncbi:MAG TPA: replication initiation protein [Patescibacteria group bacterium]|nr:replication initiation protein [Patescibacteria group bacterium]